MGGPDGRADTHGIASGPGNVSTPRDPQETAFTSIPDPIYSKAVTESSIRSVALVSAFPPPIGGVTVHVSRLADRLEGLGWRVVRVDTGAPDGLAAKALTVLRLVVRLLWERFRGNRLFHFHTSRGSLAFLVAGRLVRLLRGRVVLSVHSGAFTDWVSRSTFHSRLLRRSLRSVDLVVMMNERQADELRRALTPGRVPRVEAVPPFVFPSVGADSRRRDPDGTFRITAMGLWKPLYAYEEVLAASESAAAAQPDARVELDLVVSTGSAVEEYRARVRQAVGTPRERVRVRIVEDMDPRETFDYLASRDLLVRPSRADSYGLCVAEALFVGTPAVATDVCRRPAGTRLYTAGDVEALTQLIAEHIRAGAGSAGRTTLDPGEDAALRLTSHYAELLGEHTTSSVAAGDNGRAARATADS